MSAPKHPRKQRRFPEGELAFRSERGEAMAEHKRRSARPQLFTAGGAKITRKRPHGRLAP